MAQKFFVPVTIQDLSTSGSDAITVFLDTESYARVKLEAGGRIVWGDGAGAGDTNLYRDSANVLKTDDDFKVGGKLSVVASSGDEGGEIFLAQAQTNSTLSGGVTIDVYQNKIRFFEQGGDARGAYIDLTAAGNSASTNLLSGGGGATTLDGLNDVTAPSPSSGDFLKYNGTAWVNDPINLGTDTTGDYVASLVAGTNVALTNNSGEGATPTVTVSGALTSIDSVSSPDYVQFDTSVGSPASTEGKMQWDSDFGTLSFGLEGNNSLQQIGFNQFAYCYNADSVTLTKGTPVYIFGGQGSQVSIKRALNTSDATSARTLGLVSESIASGASGYVCTYGVLQGIDTSAYNEGDILYLGATAGTLTTTQPYAPNHYVFVGVVIKDDVGGEIWVRPQNGYELDEIHNVDLVTTPPASGDFLKYNGTLWVNDAINLGTDTVGNYVSDVTAGTGVTVTHTPSEGSSPTIAIGQAVGTASNVTFGSVTSTGNVIKHVDINAQTASYTLVLSDDGKLVEMGVGSANTLTIPPNADVAFPVGTSIDILQTGSGKTQIVAGSGVTANSANGLYLRAQWSAVTLIKRATNTWVVFGDTSTS